MRSEVARCLYGFTNAPLSATISITSGGGEASVETTAITEENGWLKLGAYNFTFSSPTLKIKLTQVQAEKPKTEAPKVESIQSEKLGASSKSVSPQRTLVKKKIIRCIKGNTTRIVSGVSPNCPKGFRKK